MMLFKACPRCRGDLHVRADMYGEYKECLQCGYMVDSNKPRDIYASAAALMAATKDKKKKAA